MTRHPFFAITLLGTGLLFISPAEAMTAPNVWIKRQIAWADVPTSLVGPVTFEGTRTNACSTATGR